MLIELVGHLSTENADIRATYMEKMLKEFGAMDLTDENLTTLAFGAKNDVSLPGRLDDMRGQVQRGLKELKQLEDDREHFMHEVIEKISSDMTDYEHTDASKLRMAWHSSKPQKSYGRSTSGSAGGGAAGDEFKYAKNEWELVTGNLNDPGEIPHDIDEMLHKWAKRRRAADKGDNNVEEVDTSGPILAITFKPKHWVQFQEHKGAEFLKNIRKDALRTRHQSTVVVGTEKGTEPERRMSIKSSVNLRNSLSSGTVLTFRDLLRSMRIFFHLEEDELRAFEAACEPVEYTEDEEIVSEGSVVGSVYLIASGVVTTKKEKGKVGDSFGVQEVVGSLSRGDFFGDCLPKDASSVKASKMKALMTYVATTRAVNIYQCPGPVFSKYAYKLNRNMASSEIVNSLAGTNRAVDEMLSAYAFHRAKSRLASAVAMAQEAVGRVDTSLSMARISTAHASRADETSLLAHIDQYLEFSMVVESETYLQDVSSASETVNKIKQYNAAMQKETAEDGNEGDGEEGKKDESGDEGANPDGRLRTRSRARASIFGVSDGMGGSKRSTVFGLSAQSLAAKNRTSLAARKSLFDRDFASPSTTTRGADGALIFEDGNSRTADSFPDTVSQASELDDDPAIIEQRRVEQEAAKRRAMEAEVARRLKEAKDQKKLLMQNVLCCTTPENSLREMIDSLLDLIKEFFDVERVGIFVIDKVHSVMSLHRSMDEEGLELGNDDNDSTSDLGGGSTKQRKDIEIGRRARTVEVPLTGIAGHIARTGEMINLADAHDHGLFDKTMDKKTGYRTRQMLCVPCFDSQLSSNVVGVLQIINCRTNGAAGAGDGEGEGRDLGTLHEGENEDEEPSPEKAGAKTKSKDKAERDFVSFSKQDEMLSSILASQIGSLLSASQNSRGVTTTNTVGGESLSVKVEQMIVVPASSSAEVSRKDKKLFPSTLKVRGEIYHGFACLGESETSVKVNCEPLNMRDRSSDPGSDDGMQDSACVYHISQDIHFDKIMVRDLPMGARMFLQFYGPKKAPYGWCVVDLFDFQRELVVGPLDLVLWDHSYDQYALAFPAACSMSSNSATSTSPVLKVVSLQFKMYDETVVHESAEVRRVRREHKRTLADYVSTMSAEEKKAYKHLGYLGAGTSTKVVTTLHGSEEDLIWKMRHGLSSAAAYLPATMLSAAWGRSEMAASAYRLLGEWSLPDASAPDDLSARTLGLHLLQGCFADPKVRSFALFQLLKNLRHSDVMGLWMALLQCLQYERFFDSSLIRFVMRESLNRPYDIGNEFYWYQVSDSSDDTKIGNRQRAKGLSVAYLRNSGDRVRTHLGHTEYIHEKVSRVVRKVFLREEDVATRKSSGQSLVKTIAFSDEGLEDVVPKEKKLKFLKEGLGDINLPGSFAAPYNAALRCTGMDVNSTRIIKSFPRKSVRVSFTVDENNPELASIAAAKERGETIAPKPKKMAGATDMNEAAMWVKVGADPSFERVAVQMLRTINYIWKVKSEDKLAEWDATWQKECLPVYTIISQVFGHAHDKYRSTMYGIPQHAVSLRELMVKHHALMDTELADKSGLFDKMGFSNKPKAYTRLTDREFPDDLVENWFLLHNFDASSPGGSSYTVEHNANDKGEKIPAVVIRRNPSKLSSYDKYNQKNPKHREAIVGLRSTRLKGGKYAPKTDSVAWRKNYARSLAYYFVSSLVLGVENRNTDNIFFLPNGVIFNFEMNLFGLETEYGIDSTLNTSAIKSKLRSLASNDTPTKVPMLSCFVRALGPRKGKLFRYFTDRAWEAFLLLRRSAPLLNTMLKMCLTHVSCVLDGVSSDGDQGSRGFSGSLHPQSIEAISAKLRNSLFLDEDSSKWGTGEDQAKAQFMSVLTTALNDGTSTHGADSYPAPGRFPDELFTSTSY